eukprot:8608751-Prorocentrum_lima.AAC.1
MSEAARRNLPLSLLAVCGIMESTSRRCRGVRLRYSSQRLNALQHVEHSLLWFWSRNSPQ